MPNFMESLRDDFDKLSPAEVAAAMKQAAQAANWAIQHAITKFTPEQKEKIQNSALRHALKDAIKAKARSSGAAGHRQCGDEVTPEQQETIQEAAREDFLRDALAKVRASPGE